MMDFLLVLVLSFDTLLACVAYGIKQIQIPFASKLTLAAVGTSFLGISLLCSRMLANVLPDGAVRWIGFSVLLLLGLINFGESMIKRLIQKFLPLQRSVKLNCVNFTLNVYLDKTSADRDFSKTLSCTEAFFLALPLSMDSLASGLSIVVSTPAMAVLLLLFSLCCGIAAAFIGTAVGTRAGSKGKTDLSWLSGLLLIFLALGKIIR